MSLHSPQPTRPSSVSTFTNVQGRQPPSQWRVSIRAIFTALLPPGGLPSGRQTPTGLSGPRGLRHDPTGQQLQQWLARYLGVQPPDLLEDRPSRRLGDPTAGVVQELGFQLFL